MAKVKNRSAELKAELKERYERWEELHTVGGSDPNWSDGINMWLVRNHIISYKRQCEQELREEEYPEEYWWELPPEVSKDYMARPDEIRQNAKKFYEMALENEDYQYLVDAEKRMDSKSIKSTHVDNVVGCVKWLKECIAKDDLVRMRLYERKERYLETFRDCRKRVEELMAVPEKKELKEGQLSFFDLFSDVMG